MTMTWDGYPENPARKGWSLLMGEDNTPAYWNPAKEAWALQDATWTPGEVAKTFFRCQPLYTRYEVYVIAAAERAAWSRGITGLASG